jgi:hypothetical protein
MCDGKKSECNYFRGPRERLAAGDPLDQAPHRVQLGLLPKYFDWTARELQAIVVARRTSIQSTYILHNSQLASPIIIRTHHSGKDLEFVLTIGLLTASVAKYCLKLPPTNIAALGKKGALSVDISFTFDSGKLPEMRFLSHGFPAACLQKA